MSSFSVYSTKKAPKTTVMTVVTILGILFLALLVAVIISWVSISFDRFTDIQLEPGMAYSVAGRSYVFPEDVKIEGKCYLMKEQIIEDLRELMKRSHELLCSEGIPYHLSGGSALGALRQGTIPMPQDDDIDIHTELGHREYLFSPKFRAAANEFGLETSFLPSANLNHADKHGAAVRLYLKEKGLASGTLDIFFLKQEGDKIVKIDGWLNGVFIPSSKESWSPMDVYPRKKQIIDGLEVYLPKNGIALAKKQYSDSCMNVCKVGPKILSHKFPMQFLRLVWQPSPSQL